MPLEEPVERLALVRAERKGRRLGHDARIERRRLDHAGELGPVRTRHEERPGRKRALPAENFLEVLDQQRQLRQAEPPVDCLPIQPPDRLVSVVGAIHGGEVGCDQWRVGPVQQPRRQAVVLRRHQNLPVVDRLGAEMGPGIADEVAEDVFFQIGLGVRRGYTAENVQAGEERPGGIRSAAVDAGVAAAAGKRVGLARRDLGEQIAQVRDGDFGDRHSRMMGRPPRRARSADR